MRLFDFVSVKLSLFLILGICLGYWLQPNTIFIGALLTIFILGLVFTNNIRRKNLFYSFGMLSYLVTILLGIFITSSRLPHNQPHHFLKSIGKPHEIGLKISEVLKQNEFSDRYFAKVTSISGETTSGTIILYVTKDSIAQPFLVDDELLIHAKIDSINPPLNPYQFDFKDYLNKQGIYGQIRLHPGQWIKHHHPSQTIFGIASNFCTRLIQKLQKQGFGQNEIGVIQALLLGQRNDISKGTYDNYKKAGAVHILAVSGLHVGILLLLLQFLLRPLERLPRGKTVKVTAIIALLWSYAFVAGLSPSIVRAVTMFSFLAYALHLNRPTNTFNILALSMFFILLVKPLFLFQVGFQMSYAAVFAIVWLYPRFQRLWHPRHWLPKKVWQLLSVSISAQLGVLPLSLYYFHQFPALFFISNLVVVPFLGIILGMGVFVLALTWLEALPTILVKFYNGLIHTMNMIIQWVAQQEDFLFEEISFDSVQLVLGYAIIVSFIFSFSRWKFRPVLFTLIGLVLFSGYIVLQQYQSLNKEKLVLLHQTRNSILLHQRGNKLTVSKG